MIKKATSRLLLKKEKQKLVIFSDSQILVFTVLRIETCGIRNVKLHFPNGLNK